MRGWRQKESDSPPLHFICVTYEFLLIYWKQGLSCYINKHNTKQHFISVYWLNYNMLDVTAYRIWYSNTTNTDCLSVRKLKITKYQIYVLLTSQTGPPGNKGDNFDKFSLQTLPQWSPLYHWRSRSHRLAQRTGVCLANRQLHWTQDSSPCFIYFKLLNSRLYFCKHAAKD